jgi:cyclophilin family peptidyl-prolyl cis-trans isomerase
MRKYFPGSLILFALSIAFGANVNAEAQHVVMKTSMGQVTIELDAEKAPITVENFLNYVDEGAYDGAIFHRVIPGFMIQGGGLTSDLAELPDNGTIWNEADNGLQNLAGTLAMARHNEIDTASRQFFINVNDNVHLDHSEASCTREDMEAWNAARERGLLKPLTCKGFGYAVFGRIIEGMEVVNAIEIVETHSVEGYDDVPVAPVTIESIRRIAED